MLTHYSVNENVPTRNIRDKKTEQSHTCMSIAILYVIYRSYNLLKTVPFWPILHYTSHARHSPTQINILAHISKNCDTGKENL